MSTPLQIRGYRQVMARPHSLDIQSTQITSGHFREHCARQFRCNAPPKCCRILESGTAELLKSSHLQAGGAAMVCCADKQALQLLTESTVLEFGPAPAATI
ncbi:hypothetical protein WJX77_011214 [Trebouxia sp. C0004]